MSKPTITLGMIVKDEVDAVAELVTQAQDWGKIDAVILTVSDKKACQKLKRIFARKSPTDAPVKIYHRAWTNRFDEARNDNMQHVKTSHFLWLDSDDLFNFTNMDLIQEELDKGADVIWLPYNYDHDEDGNLIVQHWRERVIPMNKGFTWKGWVHENCITDEPVTSKRLDIPVIHNSDHKKESEKRNHDILVQAYRETEDPRYIHYLGLSYFTQERWQEAIDIFKEYIQVGGWDEEIYRSLIKMAEAAVQLGKFDEAAENALRASGLLPEYPQAFYQLADIEFKQENWKQCLEWLKVAAYKPQPETASIVDPTVPDKARLMGAVCEFKVGNAREAAELIKGVYTVDTGDLPELFEYEASVERLAAILPALKKHYQIPELLWTNLHEEIKYDNRFRKFREAVTEPRTWPKDSIVFFCGRGYEEWGPHTLDKGMGGSEEAIVYLSRELAKLGEQVVVYGAVPKPMTDWVSVSEGVNQGVRWFPWTHVDKRDTFDTLIVWRYPQLATQFKAKRKFVDMHDLMPKSVVKNYPDTTYLFKSQFHKDQYEVDNYNIIGNGIMLEQFNNKERKDAKKKMD